MLAAFYGRAGCIQTLLQAGVNKLVSPLGARRPPHLKQKVLPWAQTSASKRLRQLTAWTARLVARAARAHYRCCHGLREPVGRMLAWPRFGPVPSPPVLNH